MAPGSGKPSTWEILQALARPAGRWAGPAIVPLIPPAAVVLAWGTEFVRNSHPVPGWVILLTTALLGLLGLSVAFNVKSLLQHRRGRRRMVAIVPEGYAHSLHWSLGERQTRAGSIPSMMVVGDFQITNLTKGGVGVPRTVLVAWARFWGIIPYRVQVVGPGLFQDLQADTGRHERLHWTIDPPIRTAGRPLRAKVGLVDHLGRMIWTPWIRWPY